MRAMQGPLSILHYPPCRRFLMDESVIYALAEGYPPAGGF